MNFSLIHHFLEHSTRRFPDKVALVHGDIRATYRQINNRANHLARFLISQGVNPGDRVAFILENSLEYVVTYYAVLKAGAVAVPLNTELKGEGILPLLQELENRILISSRKFERLLRTIDFSATDVTTLVIKSPKLSVDEQLTTYDWDEIVDSADEADLNLDIAADQLGSIIYTSGSTGRSKGVMLTHANVTANVTSICQYLQITDKDIQMVVLPFFYIMGKSLLNTHMAVGGRIVINNKFAYPATVISDMVEEQVTSFSGVPSTYALLLHQSPLAAAREKLTSLRYCSQAGGHMAAATKKKLLEVLPAQTRLVVMYGATEASARLAYVAPDMLETKIDSIGTAIPGVTLKVLGPDGTELPIGEVGELIASGANIMQGYWKNPQATAEALSAHGYHTGDLAYKDADGYFFIVGRKDNQLKVGGHRINTQEIEDLIMASGRVMEVAVVGVPDPLLENKLVALLVTSEGNICEDEIISWCRKQLPSYKIPQAVKLVASLPKNANGKVDRGLCVDLALIPVSCNNKRFA